MPAAARLCHGKPRRAAAGPLLVIGLAACLYVTARIGLTYLVL